MEEVVHQAKVSEQSSLFSEVLPCTQLAYLGNSSLQTEISVKGTIGILAQRIFWHLILFIWLLIEGIFYGTHMHSLALVCHVDGTLWELHRC